MIEEDLMKVEEVAAVITIGSSENINPCTPLSATSMSCKTNKKINHIIKKL